MRLRPLFAVLVLAGAGCAPRPPLEEPTPPSGNGNRGPIELGCPYNPAIHGGPEYVVTLGFRVLPDGSVDPTTIRWLHDRYDTQDESYVDRARVIALNCEYRPALLDGRPVEATVQKRFLIPG